MHCYKKIVKILNKYEILPSIDYMKGDEYGVNGAILDIQELGEDEIELL